MTRIKRKGRERFHLLEPDYIRPVYEVASRSRETILEALTLLYGRETAHLCLPEVERLMQVYHAHKSAEMIAWEKHFDPADRFTQEDCILITYGDLIHSENQNPLDTLAYFCNTYLKGTINTLHILPFFPYTSDRGFAVTDFEQVDPRLGDWEDIEELKADFRLMFDGVFNHVSSKSRWFSEFLADNPEYEDFFIKFSTRDALSQEQLMVITRPRTSELLSEFSTLRGSRWVWTTFSKDQIDLNFKNPQVLLKMLHILLTYVRRGADLIRLDAVTYLWAEPGTSCVHLDQTHAIIRLFRAVLDAVAPGVSLVTETNVPHDQNISYFGNGDNEAHMVYNFALPPLVLHTFQTADATALTDWAKTPDPISPTATFFNFLDSHDGIGVTPVKDILSPKEIEMMALRVVEHGGFISFKDNGDGTQSPYEMNITWYSAINREDADESDNFQVRRYAASRAVALSMMGVPGIYIHGLLGSKNDADAVLAEKHTRSINRRVLDANTLEAAINDPDTTTSKASLSLGKFIRIRCAEPAFHPQGAMEVLRLDPGLFSLVRRSPDNESVVLVLINVTGGPLELELDERVPGFAGGNLWDLITEKELSFDPGRRTLTLRPYDVLWLKARP